MGATRIYARLLPRDALDLLIGAGLAVWLLAVLLLLPVALVVALLLLGMLRPVAHGAGAIMLFALLPIAISTTVFRLEIHREGLRFVRLVGGPRFLAWADITDVSLVPRGELVLKGWLWPPWPPREASASLTALGHYRIRYGNKVRYFPPRDPAAFVSLLSEHGVLVCGGSAVEPAVANPEVPLPPRQGEGEG